MTTLPRQLPLSLRLVEDEPQQRAALATLIWSAKESALKAILKGLSVDTFSIQVDAPPTPLARDTWLPLRAHQAHTGETFSGWWRRDTRFVWTVFGGDGKPVSLEAEQPALRHAGV